MTRFCTNCGTQYSPNARFCTGCGASLVESKCPTCGQNWPGNSAPQASAVQTDFQVGLDASSWANEMVASAMGGSPSSVMPVLSPQNYHQLPTYGSQFNEKTDCFNCGAEFDKKTKICQLCSKQN